MIADNETLDIKLRMENLLNIQTVSKLPIIVDADTGRNLEYFLYSLGIMQQIGISAVVIEDKKGLKRNSLLGQTVVHELDDIASFCNKIRIGKKVIYDKNFLLIARMEGLVVGRTMEETVHRAYAATHAGADAILIHSIEKTSQQIATFSQLYKQRYPDIPLICIPTTYSLSTSEELSKLGFNIIIYANHMIRSSYKVMSDYAQLILKNNRTYEIEKYCVSLKHIFTITNIYTS